MRHLVYSVRYPVVPNTSSLLTTTFYSPVITALVYNDKRFHLSWRYKRGRLCIYCHPVGVLNLLSLQLYEICHVQIIFKEGPYTPDSGPGSVVGIATGYGLDGPGIEFRWGRDFPHLSIPALGPTQPSVQWVPGLSRG